MKINRLVNRLIRRIERTNFYSRISLDNLAKFLRREAFNFLLYSLYLFLWTKKRNIQKTFFQLGTDKKNKTLVCPVRGSLSTRIYDSMGNFTEEYYRIKIIKQLLERSFPQRYMNFHHRIQIGHGGKNSFIPDLVIKNKSEKGYFLVLEVKKNSNKMKEALLYQLNPGIRILNSRYGIYYDGSEKSSCFRRDGSKVQNFNFSRIPTWFYDEWKWS